MEELESTQFSESEMTECVDAAFNAFCYMNNVPDEARNPVWDRNTREMLLPVAIASMNKAYELFENRHRGEAKPSD